MWPVSQVMLPSESWPVQVLLRSSTNQDTSALTAEAKRERTKAKAMDFILSCVGVEVLRVCCFAVNVVRMSVL